jgi:uncharacterized membrane protein/ferritin-like metal-binding protein YciE
MAMRLHELHPSLVHFPLALVPASLALDIVGRLTGSQALMNTARVLMPVAAATGAVAGVAGLIAQETVNAEGRAHDTLVTHRNLNVALLGLTVALATARVTRQRPGWGYLAAGLGGVAGMNYTAYLGGKLAYTHGVGVERSGGARPESIEIRRGSYAQAALASLSYVGQGLMRVVRELLRGEIVPLLRSERRALRGGSEGAATDEIETMEALYTAEVQELHSAESQLCALLERLPQTLSNLTLERELRGYGTEIRTRREDLERILVADGVNPRQHPDQAMQALLGETRKMAQLRATNLRSAALIASLQRLLHYKIAGYGTVATYAQNLGRIAEAARFAEYADRDRSVDLALSSIAKEIVNPQARVQPDASATTRPH